MFRGGRNMYITITLKSKYLMSDIVNRESNQTNNKEIVMGKITYIGRKIGVQNWMYKHRNILM